MRYLLDTNVVSALRVRGRNPAVEAWAASIPFEDLCIAAFTVAEIERGVTVTERIDPAQGAVLRRWLEQNVAAGDVNLSSDALARLEAAFPPGVAAGDRYQSMDSVNG